MCVCVKRFKSIDIFVSICVYHDNNGLKIRSNKLNSNKIVDYILGIPGVRETTISEKF